MQARQTCGVFVLETLKLSVWGGPVVAMDAVIAGCSEETQALIQFSNEHDQGLAAHQKHIFIIGTEARKLTGPLSSVRLLSCS
jgi:hypothetical protein